MMEILHAYKCDNCGGKEIVAAETDSTGLPPTWFVVNKTTMRAGKTRGNVGHPDNQDRALACDLSCASLILYNASLKAHDDLEKHIEGLREKHSKPETIQPAPVAVAAIDDDF